MMSGTTNPDEVYNHYLSSMTPDEIAEHFKDICPELGDLNAEEVLLMQESAFQYIQTHKQKRDTNLTSETGETSKSSSVSTQSSHETDVENQLAQDEALAIALELGDDFDSFYIHEQDTEAVANTGTWNVGVSSIQEGSQSVSQDDFDPDRMTYEELQSLGESVGSESKGLSADIISRLPTFKYKLSLFSKMKKAKEECVICCDGFKNGDKMTSLPCIHQYHSNCITPWLQENKQCPICQKEVKDE